MDDDASAGSVGVRSYSSTLGILCNCNYRDDSFSEGRTVTKACGDIIYFAERRWRIRRGCNHRKLLGGNVEDLKMVYAT